MEYLFSSIYKSICADATAAKNCAQHFVIWFVVKISKNSQIDEIFENNAIFFEGAHFRAVAGVANFVQTTSVCMHSCACMHTATHHTTRTNHHKIAKYRPKIIEYFFHRFRNRFEGRRPLQNIIHNISCCGLSLKFQKTPKSMK